MAKAAIAIHGGAGAITRAAMSAEKEQAYRQALYDIVTHGQSMLAQGASALDTVTEAVRRLEECPLFNAGKGAVFTRQGTHELDACIMDGRTLQAGAVAGVSRIRNPVLAARALLENSPHVLLAGEGAEAFARAQGLEQVEPDFFSTPERWEQLQRALGSDTALLDHDGAAQGGDPLDPDRKFGTVGAVALDNDGNLAAATSTGGMTNKQVGRIGDSPLPGAGCYASNDSVAVSCTGTGEVFIRTLAAYDVAAQMRYGGRTLQQASVNVIHDSVLELGGSGGLIAVDREGNVALPFNSEGMYRAYARTDEAAEVAIYRES
ncbi:beta-aspartyl-peptidase (threonine type) [Pantoea ananatis]|jgi:beta-aspartyl-peptidase (threonine type)|uniref:Isoaspartyl peptidase n=1 Tax=Pantoea ananatis (strain LMG 20103) TaxID=706191 RepID=D4GNB1_PANAM|nr:MULTISPECIES: isoaspartyl peptidase/L-asparaginase [Pantoea]ADD76462.1 YbiK [Pantoea ananatis LMG 20103]AER33360.1 putative L-asparaginase precursor YbiK [Pantoea ananatis PA13]MCS3405269.1 isoaspartyl peptidase/L-asparaginase [Pantoea sp. B566]MCS4493848.1 isoaspartyl peptidase/L-asparaginase [Pantoea sp. B623]MDC7869603.1 beta-aspartyl-peptidase [Pantoea ananatis]